MRSLKKCQEASFPGIEEVRHWEHWQKKIDYNSSLGESHYIEDICADFKELSKWKTYFLREDVAKFLQFCGAENLGFQFYDLIWWIIVFLSMLAINGGPVCQIGNSTKKKRN